MAGGTGLRVGIVGGSLGGAITALQLRDVGCDVRVFERSPEQLRSRGAGIVLHPVTTRFFEEHRLLDLDRVSSSARVLRYLTREGDVLLEEPIFYRFTSYATLHAALVRFLEPERYHLRSRCVGLDQDADGVTMRIADGRVERFDLVVGADGIHSSVRGWLFPEVAPAYAGYVAWRGTMDEAALPASAGALLGALTYFVGDRTHALSYAIPAADAGDRRHLNWVWYRNVPEGPTLDDLLTDGAGVPHDTSLAAGQVRAPHIDRLRRAAAGELPAPFAEAVGASAEPFVQVVVDIAVPRMAVGRVCLVGDAAFALRPHIAAGTAKAAEDARTLAAALARTDGDVPSALVAWEPVQLELGRRTLARTRDVGDRVQWTGTFRPGDPEVAFGLFEPGDQSFPSAS